MKSQLTAVRPLAYLSDSCLEHSSQMANFSMYIPLCVVASYWSMSCKRPHFSQFRTQPPVDGRSKMAVYKSHLLNADGCLTRQTHADALLGTLSFTEFPQQSGHWELQRGPRQSERNSPKPYSKVLEKGFSSTRSDLIFGHESCR